MAKPQRKLDPELEVLVQERIRPNETIRGWTRSRNNEVTVRVIDKELHRVCQSIARKSGRGAGRGRTLQFEMRDGRWVFAGEGGWIS